MFTTQQCITFHETWIFVFLVFFLRSITTFVKIQYLPTMLDDSNLCYPQTNHSLTKGSLVQSAWVYDSFYDFLICGLFQVIFLILVVNFSVAALLLLPLDYICSQVHIWMSYCFCGSQWWKITQSKGSIRLDTSLHENLYRAGFQNVAPL